MNRFIVAEVTKNWTKEQSSTGELLCQKFEKVINVNFERGYLLKDWKISAAISGDNIFTETIIAIFEKMEA